MSAGPGGEGRAPEEEEAVPSLQRLDPDRAATEAGRPAAAPSATGSAPPSATGSAPPSATGSAPPSAPSTAAPSVSGAARAAAPATPVVDTRRYRWMIGIFGLVLVLGISAYQFATHGVGETGVAPGQRLHFFAAPLAATDLQGDPNPNPTCSAAHHDPRALNVCLMARRGPLVLAFFVTGAAQCVRQVSSLQTLAARFPAAQFAAVAIGGSHRSTAALVRRHRWTIPVAYDRDGRVGALYGVAACPMVELAARGGIVRDRLIGNRWQTAEALAPRVQRLLSGAPAAG